MKTFASDNYSGVHPDVMQAIVDANKEHAPAYGNDDVTAMAIQKIREQFGSKTEPFLVFGGTGSNVTAIAAITRPYNSIICADVAHINVHEAGATEHFAGCKLIGLPTKDGKITVEQIAEKLGVLGDAHAAQPKVVSLTQATDYGTVYTVDELKKITSFAHSNGLLVHMDGARISNAAVSLGKTLKEITLDAGIDVLSLGMTKNGAMSAEAVVFFNPDLAKDFKHVRMKGMQLASKMRFMAAQFNAMFTDDLWKRNASNSNKMAKLLAEKAAKIPGVKITQKVEANEVFAIMPRKAIAIVQKQFPFYVWDEKTSEVRWIASFDTTGQDVDKFIVALKKAITG